MEDLLDLNEERIENTGMKSAKEIMPGIAADIELKRNAWIVSERPIDEKTNEVMHLTFWNTPNPVTGELERGYESKTDEYGNREVIFEGVLHSLDEFSPEILEKIKNKDVY